MTTATASPVATALGTATSSNSGGILESTPQLPLPPLLNPTSCQDIMSLSMIRTSEDLLKQMKSLYDWQKIVPSAAYFVGLDAYVFGDIIAMVYEDPITEKISTVLMARHGENQYNSLTIDARSRYFPACENLLPEYRKSNVRRALAITALRAFANLDKPLREGLNKDSLLLLFDWDETTAGDLASSMKLITNKLPSDIGDRILDLGYLQQKFSNALMLDIIYIDGEHEIEQNNKLVFLLGEQLDQLFDPLTEYSPESTENVYRSPISDETDLSDIDSNITTSILKELLRVQNNFTENLVRFLRKFVVPLRVKALRNEIPNLSISKLNLIFPPTIDEITRVNCIFLDSLNQAVKYGSFEVLKACGMTIPYFYKAYMRHEAATKTFSQQLNYFFQKFESFINPGTSTTQSKFDIEYFSKRKIDSLIHGLLNLVKLKLILDRLIKENEWPAELEPIVQKYYESATNTIDAFGRDKLKPYNNRVFTPTGKLLTELATGWPSELQYGWLTRRVVSIFGGRNLLCDSMFNEDIIIIFSDHILFLTIDDKDYYYRKTQSLPIDSNFDNTKVHKPSIPDILMHSLINQIPLTNIPHLAVTGWADIGDVYPSTYNDAKMIQFFVIGNGIKTSSISQNNGKKSSIKKYQIIDVTQLNDGIKIIDLVNKAKILNKSSPFHLFRTKNLGLSIYSTAHEMSVYSDEKSKSPFALFLNTSVNKAQLKKYDLFGALSARFIPGTSVLPDSLVDGDEIIEVCGITRDGAKILHNIPSAEFLTFLAEQLSTLYSTFLSFRNQSIMNYLLIGNDTLTSSLIAFIRDEKMKPGDVLVEENETIDSEEADNHMASLKHDNALDISNSGTVVEQLHHHQQQQSETPNITKRRSFVQLFLSPSKKKISESKHSRSSSKVDLLSSKKKPYSRASSRAELKQGHSRAGSKAESKIEVDSGVIGITRATSRANSMPGSKSSIIPTSATSATISATKPVGIIGNHKKSASIATSKVIVSGSNFKEEEEEEVKDGGVTKSPILKQTSKSRETLLNVISLQKEISETPKRNASSGSTDNIDLVSGITTTPRNVLAGTVSKIQINKIDEVELMFEENDEKRIVVEKTRNKLKSSNDYASKDNNDNDNTGGALDGNLRRRSGFFGNLFKRMLRTPSVSQISTSKRDGKIGEGNVVSENGNIPAAANNKGRIESNATTNSQRESTYSSNMRGSIRNLFRSSVNISSSSSAGHNNNGYLHSSKSLMSISHMASRSKMKRMGSKSSLSTYASVSDHQQPPVPTPSKSMSNVVYTPGKSDTSSPYKNKENEEEHGDNNRGAIRPVIEGTATASPVNNIIKYAGNGKATGSEERPKRTSMFNKSSTPSYNIAKKSTSMTGSPLVPNTGFGSNNKHNSMLLTDNTNKIRNSLLKKLREESSAEAFGKENFEHLEEVAKMKLEKEHKATLEQLKERIRDLLVLGIYETYNNTALDPVMLNQDSTINVESPFHDYDRASGILPIRNDAASSIVTSPSMGPGWRSNLKRTLLADGQKISTFVDDDEYFSDLDDEDLSANWVMARENLSLNDFNNLFNHKTSLSDVKPSTSRNWGALMRDKSSMNLLNLLKASAIKRGDSGLSVYNDLVDESFAPNWFLARDNSTLLNIARDPSIIQDSGKQPERSMSRSRNISLLPYQRMTRMAEESKIDENDEKDVENSDDDEDDDNNGYLVGHAGHLSDDEGRYDDEGDDFDEEEDENDLEGNEVEDHPQDTRFNGTPTVATFDRFGFGKIASSMILTNADDDDDDDDENLVDDAGGKMGNQRYRNSLLNAYGGDRKVNKYGLIEEDLLNGFDDDDDDEEEDEDEENDDSFEEPKQHGLMGTLTTMSSFGDHMIAPSQSRFSGDDFDENEFDDINNNRSDDIIGFKEEENDDFDETGEIVGLSRDFSELSGGIPKLLSYNNHRSHSLILGASSSHTAELRLNDIREEGTGATTTTTTTTILTIPGGGGNRLRLQTPTTPAMQSIHSVRSNRSNKRSYSHVNDDGHD